MLWDDYEVDKADDNVYFLYNYSTSSVSLINSTTANFIDILKRVDAKDIASIVNDSTLGSIISSLGIFKDKNLVQEKHDDFLKKSLPYLNITRPLNALWTMTKTCTANCRFCYNTSSSLQKEDKVLFHDKCTKIVTSLLAARPLLVCMAGGDPLIYEDTFLECAERLKKANIQVNTITNGILVTEKNITRIADIFSGVQVSIDGLKKTHDYLRRANCFTKALNAIKLLSSVKKQVSVNFVPTSVNLNDFIALGDKLSEYDNISRFTMGRFVPSAANGTLKPNYTDYLKIKEKEDDLKKRWSFTVELSPFGYAEELCEIRSQFEKNNLSLISALIESDGSVEAMDISNHLTSKVVLGNLQQNDTLLSCWKRTKQLITLDNFKKENKNA